MMSPKFKNISVVFIWGNSEGTGVHVYKGLVHIDLHTLRNLTPLQINTLRTGSFKLFKRPFPGFSTILAL